MTVAIGAMLAVGALAFVLHPLFFRPPDEAERGTAERGAAGMSRAITEEELEATVRSYRSSHPECPDCGLRPESDAEYCSACGRFLPGAN